MSGSAAEARPRTIVTTDPELDDANSLIRLLLYSNEIEIQGLVYASSQFHWRGDGRGTPFFRPDREYTEPQTSWRWDVGHRFIEEVIDRYAAVEHNLRAHDDRYPSARSLHALVRVGNVDFEGDYRSPTPGSDLIVERMLDDDPRPLFVQLWAGPSTLARALLTLEERYAGDPGWTAIRRRLSRRVVVTKFASQDDSYEEYIAPNWPEIEVRDVATRVWGYAARTAVTDEGLEYLSADWTRSNVSERGPLGAHYRVWGDGRAMPGDHNDYFGSRRSEQELERDGYIVFTPVQAPGSWISEGDTTNFLNLVGNGLRAHEAPHYGGWGGRQLRNPARPHEYLAELAKDQAPGGKAAPHYASARWFAHAQRDFAARLMWSTTADVAAVNHPPRIELRTPLDVRAAPGTKIDLDAVVHDPDGDSVHTRWWEDVDAANGRSQGRFDDPLATSTCFRLAPDAVPGGEVHLILEARDDGEPSLTHYARVVVTVR